VAPPLVHGDEWNLATRFTVNRPFEVPGKVLQPNTRYVIRLLDSPSSRNIVQIYNESQTELITMFMAISASRNEVSDHTMFTFIETEPGYPVPIKKWFYPGRLHGLEFVYAKEQATAIARHALEPILTADGGELRHLSTVDVEASRFHKTETISQSAANITKTENNNAVLEEKPGVNQKPETQEQNIEAQEQSTEPDVKDGRPAEASAPVTTVPSASPAEEPAELPRTADELPLLVLTGVICLGAGLGMRVLSARS